MGSGAYMERREVETSSLETPVLFIVFNRPDTTLRVFEEIRKARPSKLFINADGPRAHVPEDKERCEQVRTEILSRIDWPCDVQTRFLDTNLGIKYAPSSAIDWFFEHVEEGIILEADCLPDQTFFPYCEELLARYRDDERIMQISGTDVEQGNRNFKCSASYYFLSIPCIWGWATWRRAWKHYDVEVRSWPQIRDSKLLYSLLPSAAAFRLGKKFQEYYDKKIRSWDGQWILSCLSTRGLSVYPRQNLISNIGFDQFASQTTVYDPLWADRPTYPMQFPLIHPESVSVNSYDEAYYLEKGQGVSHLLKDRLKWFFKYRFGMPYLFLKKAYYALMKPQKYKEFVNDAERLLLP